jgi:nicotinate-nucleotide adenylyltransferase
MIWPAHRHLGSTVRSPASQPLWPDVMRRTRSVIVLPSRVPPHRQHQPLASPYHRFAMAALAVNPLDGLMVSDVELCAPGPSYTADTLTRLRGWGLTPAQIFFITGADAFAEIATWRGYPGVLDLAQFVVVSRPGDPVRSLRERLPELAPRMRDDRAGGAGAGRVDLPGDAPIDVSSTGSGRLRDGEPLGGLVPPAVEAHPASQLYVNTRLGQTPARSGRSPQPRLTTERHHDGKETADGRRDQGDQAALDKKAFDVGARSAGTPAFTDFFVLCSGPARAGQGNRRMPSKRCSAARSTSAHVEGRPR